MKNETNDELKRARQSFLFCLKRFNKAHEVVIGLVCSFLKRKILEPRLQKTALLFWGGVLTRAPLLISLKTAELKSFREVVFTFEKLNLFKKSLISRLFSSLKKFVEWEACGGGDARSRARLSQTQVFNIFDKAYRFPQQVSNIKSI